MSIEKVKAESVVADDIILAIVKDNEQYIDADTLSGKSPDDLVDGDYIDTKTSEIINQFKTWPWIQAPVLTSGVELGMVVFNASTFTTTNSFNGEHTATSWEFSVDPDFSTVKSYSSNNDIGNLTKYIIPNNTPEAIYARARYHSGIVVSPWSAIITAVIPGSNVYTTIPKVVSTSAFSVSKISIMFEATPENSTAKLPIEIVDNSTGTTVTISPSTNEFITYIDSNVKSPGQYQYSYRYVNPTVAYSNYGHISVSISNTTKPTLVSTNLRAANAQAVRFTDYLYIIYSSNYKSEPTTWASELSILDIRTGIAIRGSFPDTRVSSLLSIIRSGDYLYGFSSNSGNKRNYRIALDENNDLLNINTDTHEQIASTTNVLGDKIATGVFGDGSIVIHTEVGVELYRPDTDTYVGYDTSTRSPAAPNIISITDDTLLMMQKDYNGIIPVIIRKNGDTLNINTGTKLYENISNFSYLHLGSSRVAVIGGANLGFDPATPTLVGHNTNIFIYDMFIDAWETIPGYNIKRANAAAVITANSDILLVGGGSYISGDSTTPYPSLYNTTIQL